MVGRGSVQWIRGLLLAALSGALAVGCTLIVEGKIAEAVCGDGVVEGDEVCDDGDPSASDGCTDQCEVAVPCATSSDCASEDQCLGAGTCAPVGRAGELGCAWPSPVDCDDGDACTADGCDAQTGACWNLLIDADGDGHASETLGACGTDCDDADPEVNPDYPEVCGDGKDNNCAAGETDEVTDLNWFEDCDADGFAALGAASVNQCSRPSTDPMGCPAPQFASWTPRDPATGPANRDCADLAPNAHPGQADWFTGMVNGAGGYDYDCNDDEEQRWTQVACTGSVCMQLACSQIACPDGPCTCLRGWKDAAPACGDNGIVLTCGDGSPDCPSQFNRQQECH